MLLLSGTKITEERFMMDEPSGVRNDQTETSVDGAQALAFHGFDAVMGQTYEVWFIKGDFLYEVSTYKELEPGLESDLYKSVNRRYAAEEFALQLRALCSDHPVDGPPFDQVALRVALSFGRVVAEDEPACQVGRRSQHSLIMLDHGIWVIHTFENAEAGRVISRSHPVFRVEEIDRGVIGPGHRENDVAARPD